jgi:polar amino acid transport system substrate-binding protein
VVVNLILNACQALPKAECGIFISTRFDDRRNMVVLEVRDEGIGIAPEDLSRLTDPFYTTRRQSGGTGLGLSVSARIVKEHFGELDFSSVPGEGTVVTLSLPVFF